MTKHYSPSQLTTFLRCSAAWKYRYIDGLKIPPSSAMAQGTTYHKGLETNYIQKIESKVDLPIKDVLDATSTHFDDVFSDEVLWNEEEKTKGTQNVKGELKDTTIGLVRTYQEYRAPYVQPAEVEKPFKIEFANVNYTLDGRIDLINDDQQIIENKTTARTPSEVSVDHQIQGAVYAMAEGMGGEEIIYDYAVKLKTPKIQTLKFKPTEADTDFILKLTGLVDHATTVGAYLPNRTHYMCSKSSCGFHQLCTREFGGRVKE